MEQLTDARVGEHSESLLSRDFSLDQSKGAASSRVRKENSLLLLIYLFTCELCIAVMSAAIYMKGDRPFAVFLSSRPGIVFLLAVVAIVVAGAVIVHQFLAHKRSRSGHFPMIVTMNLVTVMLIVVTGEIALRAVSRRSVEGETVGRVVLRPQKMGTRSPNTTAS